MNLSKSKYCNGIQCKKMLWLDKYKSDVKEDVDNSAIMDNGNDVHEVARKLFGDDINIQFNDNLNVMIEDTKEALKCDKAVITEASFAYKNNFCSVDILVKDGNFYDIYEVKSSTHLKDVFKTDLSYQVYVLTKLGYNVRKSFVVIINSNYEYHDHLELDKLFIKIDLTEEMIDKQKYIEDNIKGINDYVDDSKEKKSVISINCFEPYKCPYFKYCTRNIESPNVFDIRSLSNKKKIELYNSGFKNYKELLKSNINDKYKMQIEYDLNNKQDYIDKNKIKEFLDTLSYPLYFLDFETFQMSIPKYEGVKPYMQVPFQYSLHYYDKNGVLKHKEFLGDSNTDPRRSLAERLVKDIKKNTCILAYNMSFEKNVIKNLASLYPDLKADLDNIYNNIKDLMIPFKNRYYYNKDMQGSYSIKYVLPALFKDDPTLDYHNLDLVHNGSEAMNIFADLSSYSIDEQKKIRKSLLEYCCLDTYAMVKIYDYLNDIVKE